MNGAYTVPIARIVLSLIFVVVVIFATTWGWGVGVGMERRGESKMFGDEHFSINKQWVYFGVMMALIILYFIIMIFS